MKPGIYIGGPRDGQRLLPGAVGMTAIEASLPPTGPTSRHVKRGKPATVTYRGSPVNTRQGNLAWWFALAPEIEPDEALRRIREWIRLAVLT